MAGPVVGASLISNLRQDLEAELKHYHVRAHLIQFVALFVGGMGTALAAGGWHVAGWGALGGLALSVAGATVRQLWPQIPWSVVEQVLAEARAVLEPAKPASGGAAPSAPVE